MLDLDGYGVYFQRIQWAGDFFEFVGETLLGRIAVLDFVRGGGRGIDLDAFLFVDNINRNESKNETGEKKRKRDARPH